MTQKEISASDAFLRLKSGNEAYIKSSKSEGDISPELRKDLCDNGQFPYAVVLTCSDSRVVPEHIFNCGLGEIFVVRVAGNVVGDSQLASIVYSADHLKSKLIVVLGHTHCGAIAATIQGGAHGCVSDITDKIALAIKNEKDGYKACKLNVEAGIEKLTSNPEIKSLIDNQGVEVVGGVYNIDTGIVDFL